MLLAVLPTVWLLAALPADSMPCTVGGCTVGESGPLCQAGEAAAT